MPVAEIDLGGSSTNGNGADGGEIANSSSLHSFAEVSEGSSRFESPQQAVKLAEEKKKISENKNPDSSAENSVLQPSAGGNNLSAASSSGSEPPTADNSKISESSAPAQCDFKKVRTPNHKILFSEIAWMGSAKSASDEWLELKNNSGRDVPLRGWQILSDNGNLGSTHSTSSGQASSPQVKIIFGTNNFSAGGFYLLERTDDNSAPNVPADEIYSGALSNSGVILGIFNPNCELADEIDASKSWPAGDNAAKKTMERSSLDLSWHTSVNAGGTPKTQNSTAFLTGQTSGGSASSSQSGSASPPASSTSQTAATSSDTSNAASSTANAVSTSTSIASTSTSQTPAPAISSNGLVLISEIMAGTDANSYDEFVELYNPGNQGIDLTSWSLKKRSSTGSESTLLAASHLNGITLQSHRYFLLVNASATLALSPDVSWPKSYTLAYTKNAVVLYDGSGAKVDEASWDNISKNESYVRDSWSSSSFHVSTTPTPQNSARQ